jgi:hypothetical protein
MCYTLSVRDRQLSESGVVAGAGIDTRMSGDAAHDISIGYGGAVLDSALSQLKDGSLNNVEWPAY